MLTKESVVSYEGRTTALQRNLRTTVGKFTPFWAFSGFDDYGDGGLVMALNRIE